MSMEQDTHFTVATNSHSPTSLFFCILKKNSFMILQLLPLIVTNRGYSLQTSWVRITLQTKCTIAIYMEQLQHRPLGKLLIIYAVQ